VSVAPAGTARRAAETHPHGYRLYEGAMTVSPHHDDHCALEYASPVTQSDPETDKLGFAIVG